MDHLQEPIEWSAIFLPEGGSEISVADTAYFAYQQIFSKEFVKTRVGLAY